MTLEELKTKLDTLKLPVSYRQWSIGQAPKLPYLLYYAQSDNNFEADNKVYFQQNEVVIELYTNTKNILVEQKLKSLLNEIKIPFSWYESYLESEKMFLRAYEITI